MKQQSVPLKSLWFYPGGRVFRVIEKHPFGRITMQEEGRAYFGETTQRQLTLSHSQFIGPVIPNCRAIYL